MKGFWTSQKYTRQYPTQTHYCPHYTENFVLSPVISDHFILWKGNYSMVSDENTSFAQGHLRQSYVQNLT